MARRSGPWTRLGASRWRSPGPGAVPAGPSHGACQAVGAVEAGFAGGGTCAQWPCGALSSLFLWGKGSPCELDQPTTDGPFFHGHWASFKAGWHGTPTCPLQLHKQ